MNDYIVIGFEFKVVLKSMTKAFSKMKDNIENTEMSNSILNTVLIRFYTKNAAIHL